MSEKTFSHMDSEGQATMVNVGHKPAMRRIATAAGELHVEPATITALKEQALPKGDALVVARIAGIQAAKRCAELIPLCHTLPLAHVEVHFDVQDACIQISATAETVAGTGVEMEALTAVTIAALTLYDMCKAIDKSMHLENVRLVSKTKTPLNPAP